MVVKMAVKFFPLPGGIHSFKSAFPFYLLLASPLRQASGTHSFTKEEK